VAVATGGGYRSCPRVAAAYSDGKGNLMDGIEERIRALLSALIDQEAAQVIVPPHQAAPGFWFGGGNLVEDEAGTVWLSGRYRNHGDSRVGLEAGARGLECALFRSDDGGCTFDKAASWSKADLSRDGREVLSIEGTALHRTTDGQWELYVSSEKRVAYPEPLRTFQKPGTGVWSIDRVAGDSPDALDASTLAPVLENRAHPGYLHVKDPVVFGLPTGRTAMVFCSHPFSWSSSNTGLALREGTGGFRVEEWEMVSRGPAWDVAATRVTDRLSLPQVGILADRPRAAVCFYDGAECLRPHEENPMAHRRPRGYSCEEIGGALWGWEDAFPALARLSRLQPMFVSPWGTGCSRYVSTLVTASAILATWQQGQADGSQPLVAHTLPMDEVERILSGEGDRR
jgi:hypothetical protein